MAKKTWLPYKDWLKQRRAAARRPIVQPHTVGPNLPFSGPAYQSVGASRSKLDKPSASAYKMFAERLLAEKRIQKLVPPDVFQHIKSFL